MGVRGLKKYLRKLEKEGKITWESWELKETDLIIDGSGLLFYFYENPPEYELNCEYGGEYSQLEEKVKDFFQRLKSNEVRPYVVFDGIMDGDKKLHTTLNRDNERIAKDDLQPSLTKQTILQALEELQVPYVVADFDADSDIASLANIMNCPVMAKDSDFLIFDIRQGYIPFKSYTGSDVNVKKFYGKQVARRLGIHPVLLPLLASLIGNDYVSEDMVEIFKENYMYNHSPGNIAESLSKFKYGSGSFAQAMTDVLGIIPDEQRKEFQETIEISVRQYQTKENNLHIHNYFTNGDNSKRLGSDLTSNGRSIPQNIVELYRRGKFGKLCMSIMCQSRVFLRIQNIAIESTNQIRTNVYKFLMPSADRRTPHKLTEYRRDGPNYGQHNISIETQADDTSIDTIESTSEDDKVIYLLQTTLSCELELLEDVPKEWWLVVAVLRYGYLHDGNKQLVTEAHLKALLLYQVNNAEEHKDPKQLQEPDLKQDLQEPDRQDLQEQDREDLQGPDREDLQEPDLKQDLQEPDREDLQEPDKEDLPEPDREDLQGFIQWQDVVYWADILYSLLCINSLPVLRPAKLYDGEKVWKLYTKLHNGIQAEKIVIDVALFQQLYAVVLEDQVKPEILEKNPFALLRKLTDKDE